MNISAYGISADIPRRWEARFFRHADGEPTLHAANFALPSSDGEFGSRATSKMPPRGLFLSLTEYRVGRGISTEHGLFAHPRPSSLDERRFSSHSLLRRRPGQRGMQRFFTVSGRAFCLYVVISEPIPTGGLRSLGDLLRTLDIGPR